MLLFNDILFTYYRKTVRLNVFFGNILFLVLLKFFQVRKFLTKLKASNLKWWQTNSSKLLDHHRWEVIRNQLIYYKHESIKPRVVPCKSSWNRWWVSDDESFADDPLHVCVRYLLSRVLKNDYSSFLSLSFWKFF